MSPFHVLAWLPQDARASIRVAEFERDLAADGRCSILQRGSGLLIVSRRHRPARLRRLGLAEGLVLGDLFDEAGADAPEELSAPAMKSCAARAAWLLGAYWGRYGAILFGRSGAIEGLLRDPSGAVEVVTWIKHGVRIVTSRLEEPVLARLQPEREIDWDVVHRQLQDAGRVGDATALRSVQTLAPGGILDLDDEARARPRQLWRPPRFARSLQRDRLGATRALRDRVQSCVAAQARGAGRILTEVSGGLDSSIVASCLVEQGRSDLSWLHHTSEERGGDERRFVDLLRRGFELDIVERRKTPFVIDPEAIARSQVGVRPSFSALDPCYDLQVSEMVGAGGIDSLFTGMAGDGLFFLSALPMIATDMVRRRGAAAVFTGELSALARWSRRSVWALGRQALLGALVPRPPSRAATPPWLTHRERCDSHPWLADADDLPPAKHRHLEELVHALLFHGASLRAAACDLVHPLLCQPVMEHVLRVPVDLLTHGGRDRAMAREAFRDKLPQGLIDRRSKGELGPYYSRAFAAGLPALRDYLLGGGLAQQGLLRERELEATLDEAHLAQFGDTGSLLALTAIEGWVRRWAP